MRTRRKIILVVSIIILAGVLFWWWHTNQWQPPSRLIDISTPEGRAEIKGIHARMAENLASQRAQARRFPRMVGGYVPINVPTNYVESPPDTNGEIITVPVIDPKYANPTNWPEDSRPEVKVVYEFAKIARPYKFDPTISSIADSQSAHGIKFVDTPSHMIDVDARNGRLDRFVSEFDSLESIREYDGVTESWGEANGSWIKKQVVGETLQIMRQLGSTYAKTLEAVSQGRAEFTPEPWRVKLPDGGFKVVYPFATVKLYGPNVSGDLNESPRVTAEYRMSSDGSFGLVRWFSLY